MASSSSVFTNQRAQAALCWIAAAELLALILQLAGAIPEVIHFGKLTAWSRWARHSDTAARAGEELRDLTGIEVWECSP